MGNSPRASLLFLAPAASVLTLDSWRREHSDGSLGGRGGQRSVRKEVSLAGGRSEDKAITLNKSPVF